MAEDPMKAVLHYAQALKAPRIRESAARLAEQARDAHWTHEEYLAAVLSPEVAPAKLLVRQPVSARPGSRPVSRWRTSTSTTNPH